MNTISRVGSVGRALREVPALILGLYLANAQAQESADPILVCSQLTDPGARLACFDQEARRRRAAAHQVHGVPVAPPPNTASTATPTAPTVVAPRLKTSDDTIGLDGKQLRVKRKEEGIEPAAPPPIVASITQLKTRPDRQYYFELDNGQVWESTDSARQLYLAPHETVSIRASVLGAFFLKTEEGNSIRVHRLR